ncbi:hypothetical protein SELMODRAFT_438157 [Selaginella moellendorffii]|uniref:Uncharacterized protein n=1 Tax=Selaginella moellendorffii TaxID=88036 RepID=D8QUK3_SELML|nr:hypothetical protein SELMODRAFT_438157 [Selaginella moellendorffii]
MRMQSASWHDYGAQEALELQTTMVQASQGSERIEASLAFMITTRASRLFKQSLLMEMYEIPTYKDLNVRGLEQSLGMWPGAAGWNPAVGARLTDFFRSNLGRRVMSLVRLLFDRHGLQDPSSDGRQDLPLCSEFLCCNYLLSKLDELMAADATTTEWEDQEETLILEAEELGTINGKLIVQVDEHPVDTVVKLMVNVVLGDFLDVAHDRETWIRDCKVLLKKRCPLRLPWKPAASVHFLEDVTMERWREMDAWIRSPGTLSVASYEQALQAMRNAIFRDGRVVDQASKEFVTRIGKLLEAKEDQVYELIDIYTDERFQKACGTNSGTTAASKKRGRGSMAEFAVVANAYPVVMGLLSKRQRCHMFMRSGCPLQGGQAITTLDMMKIKVAILRVKRRLATVHVGYACYHGNKNRC